MPFFSYKATDPKGNIHKGLLDALNEQEVVANIREAGRIPIRVRIADNKSKRIISLGQEIRFGSLLKRISTAEIMLFTQDLADLLKAGLPIDRALQILADVVEKEKFKEIVKEILRSVQKGGYLSDAMAQHPRVFSHFYTNMVRAGEAGGVLDDVLERLGDFLETATDLKDYISSALIYPIFLVGVGGISLIVLLTFVIPKFSMIFETMGQSIPLATQLLLSLSEGVKTWWWLMGALAVGLFFWLRQYGRTNAGRLRIDTMMLRAPVISDLVQKIEVARFSRTLGTLIHSGVPILQALELVKEIIGNRVVALHLSSVYDRVKKGETLSRPLADLGIFPTMSIQMITVGEETGRLDDMLLKIAENYEKNVRNSVKKFVSLFEPAIILLMGLVIGFIVISMLMAIFSLNDLPL